MSVETHAELEPSKSLLEIQVTPDTKVAFKRLEQFTTPGAHTLRKVEIPPVIEDIVTTSEKRREKYGSTYSVSMEDENWRRNMWSFVNGYVQEEGSHIMEKIGAERIAYLNPKQAIELTVLLLNDLTKYKDSDIPDLSLDARMAALAEDKEIYSPTGADQKSALQILQEGLARKDDPTWEGNGVCRNFADTGKVVFEALRDAIPGNALSTSFCLYDAGYAFAPKGKDKYNYSERSGMMHAWDTYVVVNPNGTTDVTIADFTWGREDKDGNMVNLDHTRERAEPIVFQLAHRIEGTPQQKQAELKKIFAYYADNILHPGNSGYSSESDFQRYFASQALHLIHETNSAAIVSPDIRKALAHAYAKLGGETPKNELVSLYGIMAGEELFDDVLKAYLGGLKLNPSRYNDVYAEDNRLQRLILQNIRNSPDYSFVAQAPELRARIREVGEGDTLPPFNPSERLEDTRELRFLLGRSHHLSSIEVTQLRSATVSENRLKTIYTVVRERLAHLNPTLNEDQIAAIPDYDLVAKFDSYIWENSPES